MSYRVWWTSGNGQADIDMGYVEYPSYADLVPLAETLREQGHNMSGRLTVWSEDGTMGRSVLSIPLKELRRK